MTRRRTSLVFNWISLNVTPKYQFMTKNSELEVSPVSVKIVSYIYSVKGVTFFVVAINTPLPYFLTNNIISICF